MKKAGLMEKISSKPKMFLILIALLTTVVALSTIIIAGVPVTILGSQRMENARLQEDTKIIFISAALTACLCDVASAYAISSVVKAGFAASAEKPELSGMLIILGGLAEGIAIYGFIIAILMLGKIS